jgi:glycosyltransferase involved in cell wall biosynthesis
MYKLTVIVCVYNEENSLFKALRSLYNNVIYQDTEIILIDDRSPNPVTRRILALIAKFTRYRVICSPENRGLSHSRNLGFQEAGTPYVLPLDGDDILPPFALDRIYEAFLTNPDADFLAGNYYIKNTATGIADLVNCSQVATNGKIDREKLAAKWILLGTSPCKKRTWEKAGGYRLKYSYSVQDMDFWIRVLMSGARGIYLEHPIYIWKRASTGMNAHIDNRAIAELLDDHWNFFLLGSSRKTLGNRIFEGFYPYKQKDILLKIGKKHFFNLSAANQLRFIRFICLIFFRPIPSPFHG